jgi:hypothetical protein
MFVLSALRSRLSYATVAATGAVVLGVTGLSIAAIPSSTGVIHACYKKSNGTIRVVKAGTRCGKSATALSWNREGVPGAPGPKGVAGPKGVRASPSG